MRAVKAWEGFLECGHSMCRHCCQCNRILIKSNIFDRSEGINALLWHQNNGRVVKSEKAGEMIYQRSFRCSLTHLSVILHGIWGKIIRKWLQMADSNKALEMGPGGWRYYGMLPHRELTNGAWGPREWSLNHMGQKTTTSCTKIAGRRMEMSSKLV